MIYIKYFFYCFAFIIISLFFFYPIGYFLLNNSYSYKYNEHNPKLLVNHNDCNDVECYIINLHRNEEVNYLDSNIISLEIAYKKISLVKESSLLELNELIDLSTNILYLNHSLTTESVSNSLTHIQIWQEFILSDYEYALILEDNVDFSPKELKFIIKELVDNKNLWDVVTFNYGSSWRNLNIKKLQNNKNLMLFFNNEKNCPNFLSCYLINRKAAKNLLSKALPLKLPINNYVERAWELNIRFMGIDPIIVNNKIDIFERKSSLVLPFEELNFILTIKHYIIHFQSNLIKALYNLKIYLEKKLNFSFLL